MELKVAFFILASGMFMVAINADPPSDGKTNSGKNDLIRFIQELFELGKTGKATQSENTFRI